ncbi:MAG: ABC transporter ATP-binding protein, partial [Candidatus Bathyarchaeota archaeon]
MAKGSGSAVKLVGVAKRYADVVAADHIDLDVKNGEIFGLLGPNGSGKSTLLKIILALVKPDAGSVNVLGTNVEKNPVAIKAQTGYVPEVPRLYEFLTGLEYLDFTADLYGVSTTDKRERINEYLEALE